MKFTEYGLFKLGKFVLFLGLVFMSFVSYGEVEKSLSEEQSLEQQISEMNSLEMSKGEEDLSNQAGASILSVKGEALASVPLLFKFRIEPIIPVSLEFQVPCKKNEKFKYLVLAGGGVMFSRRADFSPADGKYYEIAFPYASFDVGFKYDLQPWTVSLTAGGIVTPNSFKKNIEHAAHPILIHMKWALSVGTYIANTHVALTTGSFATLLTPFLGVSVSIPIAKW